VDKPKGLHRRSHAVQPKPVIEGPSVASPLPIIDVPDERALAAPTFNGGERTESVHELSDLRDVDIHGLLVAFYATVVKDPMLAPYFAGLDMGAHMDRIVDFWSTMLFRTGRYSGNAFLPHLSMSGLTAEHFARWVTTLEGTVDDRYVGKHAELMKALAHRIAYSMQLRLGIVPFAEYRSGV